MLAQASKSFGEDTLKKKSWASWLYCTGIKIVFLRLALSWGSAWVPLPEDTKFLFKGCGANIRALDGGTDARQHGIFCEAKAEQGLCKCPGHCKFIGQSAGTQLNRAVQPVEPASLAGARAPESQT